ncbi:MAG: glycoside hydrolase family 57 protein [Nanoarchaeota archaeon]
MTSVCCYFQVHQPYRLRRFSIFDIGAGVSYVDDVKNQEVMQKVAAKSYLPANRLLLDLIRKYKGRFKVAFSITGTALEQFEQYAPEVLDSFKKLACTGSVEFLGETYYHSLSYLFDRNEFKDQVDMHHDAMFHYFGVMPRVFRNTELIYSNELAFHVQNMGYSAILAEGADQVLQGRSPNLVYTSKLGSKIRVLLKNYKLSDDIAFRFSDKNWVEYPLTAGKFASWINMQSGDSVNLFMDYETFGEHQWEETGIFEFLKVLPGELFKKGIRFLNPSDLAMSSLSGGAIDVHNPISWADVERDTSAWLGNQMQQTAIALLYSIKDDVINSGDEILIRDWRRLTTSDHFYYMCTKWFADGDVHKYFNPYDSPYEAYIAFMNVLEDMKLRVQQMKKDGAHFKISFPTSLERV